MKSTVAIIVLLLSTAVTHGTQLVFRGQFIGTRPTGGNVNEVFPLDFGDDIAVTISIDNYFHETRWKYENPDLVASNVFCRGLGTHLSGRTYGNPDGWFEFNYRPWPEDLISRIQGEGDTNPGSILITAVKRW